MTATAIAPYVIMEGKDTVGHAAVAAVCAALALVIVAFEVLVLALVDVVVEVVLWVVVVATVVLDSAAARSERPTAITTPGFFEPQLLVIPATVKIPWLPSES